MKKFKLKHFASTLVLSILIAVLATVCAFLNNYYMKFYKPVNSMNAGEIRNVFIIDPGHGGLDGGAVGESGALEKDINLDIALCLQDLFSMSDIEACLTRTDDKMLYNENDTRSRKAQDVRNRVAFAKQFSSPVFVSIHQNKFPVSKYSGLQVYYSPNNDNSKLLAEMIQNEVKTTIQHQNNREVKKSGSTIYVLKSLDCPAVLVECGFLSNPNEEMLLTDENYRKKLSICIFSSLLKYQKVRNNSEGNIVT